jgi:alpha-L-arabinofuranosidase
MACSSDLVNGWPGGVIQRNGAQIFRTPLYYVEEMYRDNLGERLLPVTVTGPTFKSPGFNTELPALDVTASAGPTGAPIYLWVINRTEQDSPQTEISVTGGKTKLQRADVWTLTAESPLIANDYEHPARIVPVQTKLTINGENLVYQFPKNSVVVMRLSP